MTFVVGMWIDDTCYYISSFAISVRGQERTIVNDVNKAVIFDTIHYARAIAKVFTMDVYVYSVQ
jgi:hypothetical protein